MKPSNNAKEPCHH